MHSFLTVLLRQSFWVWKSIEVEKKCLLGKFIENDLPSEHQIQKKFFGSWSENREHKGSRLSRPLGCEKKNIRRNTIYILFLCVNDLLLPLVNCTGCLLPFSTLKCILCEVEKLGLLFDNLFFAEGRKLTRSMKLWDWLIRILTLIQVIAYSNAS